MEELAIYTAERQIYAWTKAIEIYYYMCVFLVSVSSYFLQHPYLPL